jgi:hypothetical protein
MSLAVTARLFAMNQLERINHRLDQDIVDVGSGMTAREG